MKLILLTVLLTASGCARFHTTQTDTSYEKGNEKPTRTITTKVSAVTFFTAKSDLAKFSAINTDKSQTTKVGALGQESSDPKIIEALGAGVGTAFKVYMGRP